MCCQENFSFFIINVEIISIFIICPHIFMLFNVGNIFRKWLLLAFFFVYGADQHTAETPTPDQPKLFLKSAFFYQSAGCIVASSFICSNAISAFITLNISFSTVVIFMSHLKHHNNLWHRPPMLQTMLFHYTIMTNIGSKDKHLSYSLMTIYSLILNNT